MQGLDTLDVVCLIGYFVGVGLIGFWASRRSLESSQSYFLSGRSVGWIAIGASLFASNISTEHFMGLAGSGAASGLAVGQFELLACLVLLLLGWLFVPFYLRTGVFTMPEFLERRYNSHCRTYLSAVSLVAYIFTKISVSLYAGALILGEVLGWNIWVTAIILVVATGIYTIFGGLRAVIYTELFQAFILILGSIILTVIAVGAPEVGGLSGLVDKVKPEFFSVWRNARHPDFPWTGILFGAPLLGIWYWCTDQMIVQRTLAARDLAEAQRGAVFAGFLKVLPVFILVLPGVAGGILFPDLVANNESNRIYPALVTTLLPVGIKGLVIAALLAALMSSLAAVFNSSSTLVTIDFYKKWRPQATEKQLVRVGQIATVILVAVGLAWVPFIDFLSKQLFVYLQSVQAYISPPIAAVFLVGLLWKRASGAAALATLLTGFVLGSLRFIVELGVKGGWITSPALVNFASINFLHFAIILFVVSLIVIVGVSVATRRPTAENLSIFVPAHAKPAAERASRLNIALSIVLALTVLIIWLYFSPLVFGAS